MAERSATPLLSGMNGLMAGWPLWARIVVTVTFTFGFQSVVAGLFLAAAFGWVSSPITETNTKVIEVQRDQRQARQDSQAMKELLLAICINGAKGNTSEIRNCMDAHNKLLGPRVNGGTHER